MALTQSVNDPYLRSLDMSIINHFCRDTAVLLFFLFVFAHRVLCDAARTVD